MVSRIALRVCGLNGTSDSWVWPRQATNDHSYNRVLLLLGPGYRTHSPVQIGSIYRTLKRWQQRMGALIKNSAEGENDAWLETGETERDAREDKRRSRCVGQSENTDMLGRAERGIIVWVMTLTIHCKQGPKHWGCFAQFQLKRTNLPSF